MAHESLLLSGKVALEQGRFPAACHCFIQANRLQRSGSDTSGREVIRTATELVLLTLQSPESDKSQLIGVLLRLRKELKDSENCQIVDLALALAYRRLSNPALAVRFNTKAIKQGPERAEAFLSMSATLYALSDLSRASKYGSQGYALACEELRQAASCQRVAFFSEECEALARTEERLQRPAWVLEWRRRALSLLETFGTEGNAPLLQQSRKALRVAIRAYRASAKGNRNSFPLLGTVQTEGSQQWHCPKPLGSGQFAWNLRTFDSQRISFDRLRIRHREPFSQVKYVQIQSFFRSALAKLALQQQRLIRHNQRPLILQCAKELSGKSYIVSVYASSVLYEIEAICSQHSCKALIVPRPCSLTLPRLLSVLEANTKLQLYRKDEVEAALVIQRRFKGFLARRHRRRLQLAKENSVQYRRCVEVDGCFYALLLKREKGQVVLRTGWGSDLILPACLSEQSWELVLKKLKWRGKNLCLEEHISNLPTAATLSTYDIEEEAAKPSKTAFSAALRIQRLFRGFQARRKAKLLQTRSRILLYRGHKKLEDGLLASVFMYTDRTDLLIEAVTLQPLQLFQLRLPLPAISQEKAHILDLFTRLYIREKELALAPTSAKYQRAAQLIQKAVRGMIGRFRCNALRSRRTWKMQIIAEKHIGLERFNLAVYSYKEQIRVEIFKLQSNKKIKYASQSYLLTNEDLLTIYGEMPQWERLIRDLRLDDGKLKICTEQDLQRGFSTLKTALKLQLSEPEFTRRYEVKATSRLDNRLWVVTMYLPSPGTAEFVAYVPGAPLLKTSVALDLLAATLRLSPQNIRAVGALAIYKLLKLEEGKLVLDLSVNAPDLNKLAARLQAYVRGFLVRCKVKIKPQQNNIIACIVTVMKGEEWVLYAYREPPQIHLIGIQRPSRLQVEGFLSDSILLYFPPTLSHKQAFENLVFPRLMLVPKDGTYILQLREEARHLGIALTLLKPMVTKALCSVQQSSGLLQLISSVSKVKKEPVKYSKPTGELVLRSGLELGGRFYLASFYKTNMTLTVQIEDQKTGLVLCKVTPYDPSQSTETQCESIINRLQIRLNQTGEFELLLISEAEAVLYRRSHYISDRLYHITVQRRGNGLGIEALDPVSKATLSLQVAVQMSDFREISRLVERLKVKDAELYLITLP